MFDPHKQYISGIWNQKSNIVFEQSIEGSGIVECGDLFDVKNVVSALSSMLSKRFEHLKDLYFQAKPQPCKITLR